jgi:hypothetical protein
MSALQFIHILPRALWILAHSWPWWRSCLIWLAIAAGVISARGYIREMRALAREDFLISQKEKYQNVEDSESTLER